MPEADAAPAAQPQPNADPANNAAPPPTLTSLLKDTKNVKRQDFLLHHDLDDIAGARELYLQSRSEWLEFFALLQIFDPLIDYAAARNGVPQYQHPRGRRMGNMEHLC